MANIGLEIVFWLILLTYIVVIRTQTIRGYKKQF